MNQKTLKLLSYLRHNSREKLTTISKKTNIPISTLFDQLKELQSSLITKSTILLDYSKLGFHTRAKILLKVELEDKEKLQKHLNCHESVNNIYKINSGWSFMIETIHQNNRELDKFLDNLENNFAIENQQIHYLIEDVKREGFALGKVK